jgi:formylglycine-generating enzyme required for sulfatase activity
MSLSDERTLSGDASIQDTVIDDIEVVDLNARYKIEGVLGQGGMGAVQLATDTRLDRKVAIKRILGEAARSKAAITRFVTEAKAIAALNHPNIVQIYDYGRAKDGPFLIMEYVDGGCLSDLCKSGDVPLEKAVDIICHVCDGLAVAHDLGIIHRDIKPANILLNRAGIPKLTDFGLAKAEAHDHGMTMTGAVMGTPDFMPPEQRRDAALVDHRSDLWSLAATVYQLVTGRSPKIIRFNDVPASLQEVLGKALEESKEDRYQSATDLRRALRAAVSASATRVAPQSDLAAGECPACHTPNDSQRKFCRECAASLRSPCLACESQIPVWDKVCPECGKKQPELLAAKLGDLGRQREAAEELRSKFAFDEALAVISGFTRLTDKRFEVFAKWGEAFCRDTAEEKAREWAARDSKLREAQTHRKAFDYAAAIHSIESIPTPLRTEDVSQTLASLKAEYDESVALLATLRSRIDHRELDDLIPLVNRAIVLRGDRKDLPQLLSQLTEREARIAEREGKQRAWVKDTFAKAMECFTQQGEAKMAIEAVAQVERLLTPEQRAQFEPVQAALAAEERLAKLLAEAKADRVIDSAEVVGLAVAVAECIKLVPKCQRIVSFRDQLVSRIAKSPADYADRVNDLRPLLITLNASGLQALPEVIRDPFLASRHLVTCPGCGVSLKPSRLQWHRNNKCPGRNDSVPQAKSSRDLPIVVRPKPKPNLHYPDPDGTITNSIGMKLVPIKPGEFLMGSDDSDPNRIPIEELQHRVRITRPYFIGMHAVTQAQFGEVMRSDPSLFKGLFRPVEHLSWADANEFCERLSDLANERAAGRTYRLPSEAEWEYACRAGTTTPFNTGVALYQHQACYALNNLPTPAQTVDVGTYPPNQWGLFEMHGNVWEWTNDWFDSEYYYGSSPLDNPRGPVRGTHHTLRGGSASTLVHECRSAMRGEAESDAPKTNPLNRFELYGDFGVRVVCNLPRK